jgi:hypothetical protein
MNCVRGDGMNQNLAAGIGLIVVSLGFLGYVAATVLQYGDTMYFSKQNVIWFLLQCSVAVFVGVVGGYFIGVGRKSQISSPPDQDSSVHE